MKKDINNNKPDSNLDEKKIVKEPLDEKELGNITAGTDVKTIIKTIKDIITK